MLIDSLYMLIGQLVVLITIIIIILLIVVILLGVYFSKKNNIKLPRFLLYIVDLLYSPLKKH